MDPTESRAGGYQGGHYRYQEGGSADPLTELPSNLTSRSEKVPQRSSQRRNKSSGVFYKGIDDPQAVNFSMIGNILRRLKYYSDQQIFELTGEVGSLFRTYSQTTQLLRATRGYHQLHGLAKSIFTDINPIPGTIGFYVIGSDQHKEFIDGAQTKDHRPLPKRWTPWGCRNIAATSPTDYITPRANISSTDQRTNDGQVESPIGPINNSPPTNGSSVPEICPDYILMICPNKSNKGSSGYTCLNEDLKSMNLDGTTGDYFVMLKNSKSSSFAYLYLVSPSKIDLSQELISQLNSLSIKEVMRYSCGSNGRILQIDIEPLSLEKYSRDIISKRNLVKNPENERGNSHVSQPENISDKSTSINQSNLSEMDETKQMEQIKKRTSGGPGVNPSNSWNIFFWIILIVFILILFFILWWVISSNKTSANSLVYSNRSSDGKGFYNVSPDSDYSISGISPYEFQ